MKGTLQVSSTHTWNWCEKGGFRVGRRLRRWLLLNNMRQGDEQAAWMVMTNDMIHSSFLLETHTKKADIPGWDVQLLEDVGFVQSEVFEMDYGWTDSNEMLHGEVLTLQWVTMDKQSSHGSCSYMQTGLGWAQSLGAVKKPKHRNPSYVFLSASF